MSKRIELVYVCNCTMPKMVCQDQKFPIPDKNIDFLVKNQYTKEQ